MTSTSAPALFGFGSRPTDPLSGLVNERNRSYSPATGSFVSEDPIQSANPYPYANGDPVDYIDPTGALAIETAALQSLVAFQLHVAELYAQVDRCLVGAGAVRQVLTVSSQRESASAGRAPVWRSASLLAA